MGKRQHTFQWIRWINLLQNTIIPTFIGKLISYVIFKIFKIYINPSSRIRGDGYVYLGKNVVIDEGVNILAPRGSSIFFSEGSRVGSFCHIEADEFANIMIGEKSTIQVRTQIRGDVYVGKSTLIAPNCFISSGKHLYNTNDFMTIKEQDSYYLKTYKKNYSESIVIGDDCWLGINVVILPGTKVNDHSVIGANIVVSGIINRCSVLLNNKNIVIKKRNYNDSY